MMMKAPNGLRSIFATLALVLPMSALAETPSSTSGGPKPFSSMAIAPDAGEDCRVPRPPSDLAETAYQRNGYRAILRILIAEQHLETETCDCLLGEFTWDMALAELPRFQTSDNPRLPFKVLDLYAMADALEAEHAEGCSE
jgi:hypothetical protein